jgi:hypothetical protein
MWIMAFKDRIEKVETKMLRCLSYRMELPDEFKKNLYKQEKGFEGELMFDALTAELPEDRFLVLNDLQLEFDGNKFQIDTCIVMQNKLPFFEVKNNEGDFEYDSVTNEFSRLNGRKISNPLSQASRAALLLQQLLQKHGFSIPIEGRVVFINPELTMYQAPKNKPIIYSTQAKSYMHHFSEMPSRLNDWHLKLAKTLVSLHHPEPPRLPPYSFFQLKKGLDCCKCHSFSTYVDGRELICNDCGNREKLDSAVVRCVEVLKLLFPGEKITTNLVFEWCGGMVSRKTIIRVLNKFYGKKGDNRWSHFE